MATKNKPKSTVICQGREADLEDKAAAGALVEGFIRDSLNLPRGEAMYQIAKRTLSYNFTPAELKTISQEMAIRVDELDRVEGEKKAANDGFKDRLDILKNQIRSAAAKINTGQEQRLIDCRIEKDFERNLVIVRRMDNREIVEERAMTKEERQLELDMREEKAAAVKQAQEEAEEVTASAVQ